MLLDRAGFSSGVIDAQGRENFAKALRAFQQVNGLKTTGKLDRPTFDTLAATFDGEVLQRYTITDADVEGPFVDHVPHDFNDMAKLKQLAYRSSRELLAERFHASEDLLAALNPKQDMARAGAEIVVPAVKPLDELKQEAKDETKQQARQQAKSRTAPRRRAQTVGAGEAAEIDQDSAARIEVNKRERTVRVFGPDGTLLAFYPASIGNSEKPAPSGTFEVRRVTVDPTYRYDPKYAFKGQTAKKPVEVMPGPNNPVGAVWIGLTADSYGIHGTPEPQSVGKTASHGCVRLTNWDALALARRVKKGTPVAFID